jgi:Domain of unknown function (DUF4913)
MSEYLTHAEHTVALDVVGTDIAAVRDDVAQLTETLAGVLDILEDTSAAEASAADSEGHWCWRTLTGQARVDLWDELRSWVEWFNVRYGSAGTKVAIPPCWPLHPVAVEELTALMTAWQCAHEASTASDALIAWHDRWLWPCLDRLSVRQGGFKDCTLASHDLRHTVHIPVISNDVFAKIVRDDLATTNPDVDANDAEPKVA